MINKIKVDRTIEQDVCLSITCDVCGKAFLSNDIFETQEFVYIRQSCGYGSVFGDTNEIELDMCQYCFKELLGKYARIKEAE